MSRRLSVSHFVEQLMLVMSPVSVRAFMSSAFTLKRQTSLSSEQMLYYVDNVADTIKFYHNLLKSGGTLMIVIEIGI